MILIPATLLSILRLSTGWKTTWKRIVPGLADTSKSLFRRKVSPGLSVILRKGFQRHGVVGKLRSLLETFHCSSHEQPKVRNDCTRLEMLMTFSSTGQVRPTLTCGWRTFTVTRRLPLSGTAGMVTAEGEGGAAEAAVAPARKPRSVSVFRNILFGSILFGSILFESIL